MDKLRTLGRGRSSCIEKHMVMKKSLILVLAEDNKKGRENHGKRDDQFPRRNPGRGSVCACVGARSFSVLSQC